MKAGLARFLWVWLPAIMVLFVGLARAWATGQADPWDWSVPVALACLGVGLALAKQGWLALLWVAAGMVGTALLFCTIAATRAPDLFAVAGLMAVAACAILSGRWLRDRRWIVGLALSGLVALLLWRGPAQPIAPSPDRPLLAVITALPLFWAEMGQVGRVDAPIVTVLRTRFTVQPLDDPRALVGTGARRLLLAQPRALSPDQLVAIDQWVRAGGRALVLADRLLRWPSVLPPGDRRRAPSTSLLEPLLIRWGFRTDRIMDQEIRHFTADNHLVTLAGGQSFRTSEDDHGVVHFRQIGKGQIILLGDADLLDDRLWLADPARPLDPRSWTADTPSRLIRWLDAAPAIAGRRWMGGVQGVTLALRWALIFATGWALLNAMLRRRQIRPSEIGTKHENTLERGMKIG